MAATVAAIIARVREVTQDERPPYRVSDISIVRSITDGLSEARRIRPDLFNMNWRGSTPVYSAAATTTLIALPDAYIPALVNYVTGRVDVREDSFAQDGRAMSLLQAFNVALRGG